MEQLRLFEQDTISESLGVNNIWKKLGIGALALGGLFAVNEYVDMKVERVTEQIQVEIVQISDGLSNDIAESLEDNFRDGLIDYLLEDR